MKSEDTAREFVSELKRRAEWCDQRSQNPGPLSAEEARRLLQTVAMLCSYCSDFLEGALPPPDAS